MAVAGVQQRKTKPAITSCEWGRAGRNRATCAAWRPWEDKGEFPGSSTERAFWAGRALGVLLEELTGAGRPCMDRKWRGGHGLA